MGGYFPEWKEEEIEFLLENYNKMKNRELGDRLGGRSAKAICQKYSRIMGFNRGKRKNQKDNREPVNMTQCPDCKSNKINEVEEGYFCVNCLTEYDKCGNRMLYC